MKLFKKLMKTYKKSTFWFKFITFLIGLLILTILINKFTPINEGFSQKQKFLLKTNDDLYDDFTAEIYDDLLFDSRKIDFQIKEIKRNTKLNKKSLVLDIGSGTGHHVRALNNDNIKTIGLDKSKSMVEFSKSKYPKMKFIHGSALTSSLFDMGTFSHITSFTFTPYYIKDKLTFFRNCYDWLKPGGYLIVHLVDRERFDPIINAADPLHMVSPQKHAKKRITSSIVKFKDFQYKAKFKLESDKNIATFEEKFIDDGTGNVRKHVHTLYMPKQNHILALAKNIGFKLKGSIDMVMARYEHQYLYILEKPR